MSMSAREARQVAAYRERIAPQFDAIYTGQKSFVGRALDRWLRRDMHERIDWAMSGSDCTPTVCDIGCGLRPSMLKMAGELAKPEGVDDRCRFVLSDILDWQTHQQFDLVIAVGFWDYVADPLPRLRVIRSITRDRFLSAWPRAGTLRSSLRKARLDLAGCPVYFWTRQQVDDYLAQAGFVVRSSEIHGHLYCVEASVVE